MTKQELEAKLNQLGLKVPSNEIDEMEKAMKYIDQMVESVRKQRSTIVNPDCTTHFFEDQL